MSWKNILKNDSILKIQRVTDPNTGIEYTKDPTKTALISDRTGRMMSNEEMINAAGRTPGDGTISYDNSGFDHSNVGHWPQGIKYGSQTRWFCRQCHVEFKMPDDAEDAQRQQDRDDGKEVHQTPPYGIGSQGFNIQEYGNTQAVRERREAGQQ